MIHFMGKSDYWDTPADIRVNTVNCVGVMGKGIALEFKNRYPQMFEHYRKACAKQYITPGQLWAFDGYEALEIWNVATKDHWRNPSKFEWVESAIIEMKQRLLLLDGAYHITVPALGCGNGGLNWLEVAERIVQHLTGMPHHIYVFNPGTGPYLDQLVK